MSDLVTNFGTPELMAALLFVVLNAYLLTGGADLGGGVWDLLATGPRRDAQRELIASAIGPIWEANHVWLIIVVVMLFTAFPPAFAAITTVLHIPLSLMLVGIVLRGSAFVFRSYGGQHAPARTRWGRTFAIASAVTPILLGMVAGAIATGATGMAMSTIGAASFAEVFVAPWTSPFAITTGMLTLSLVAQLAATYLTLVAEDRALRDDFRRRSILAGLVAVALAAGATFFAPESPFVGRRTLLTGTHAAFWGGTTAIVAVLALTALWRRRFQLARIAVCTQVSLIVWGWAGAQYPYVVPPVITIRAGVAPPTTLDALLVGLAAGVVLLIPSLAYLLKTFATHGAEAQPSGSD